MSKRSFSSDFPEEQIERKVKFVAFEDFPEEQREWFIGFKTELGHYQKQYWKCYQSLKTNKETNNETKPFEPPYPDNIETFRTLISELPEGAVWKDHKGNYPMYYSVDYGLPIEICELMMEKSKDYYSEKDEYFQTPLEVAERWGKTEFIEFFSKIMDEELENTAISKIARVEVSPDTANSPLAINDINSELIGEHKVPEHA